MSDLLRISDNSSLSQNQLEIAPKGNLEGRDVSCWSKIKNFISTNRKLIMHALIIATIAFAILFFLAAISSPIFAYVGLAGLCVTFPSIIAVSLFAEVKKNSEELDPEDSIEVEVPKAAQRTEPEKSILKKPVSPELQPSQPKPPKKRRVSFGMSRKKFFVKGEPSVICTPNSIEIET